MNEELRKRLAEELGLTEEQIAKLVDEGVKEEADMALLTAEQIKSITGCGLVTAKKIATAFTPVVVEPEVATSAQPGIDVLPTVPEDTSFLEMLKVGGVLKVVTTDVIAAMRAAIAYQSGLYDLPDILMTKMEDFAQQQDEPVGESFYTLQKMITSRAYGDLLSSLGVPGNFVSERRKKEVLGRLAERLWPALIGFHEKLQGWVASWSAGMNNPAMAMTMLAMSHSGSAGAVLPPGMMSPPETDTLRDEAEAVVNQINSVFAGTGIPVARALAYDAARIKGILEEDGLPAAVGAATRDQMLKSLGVNVGPDYVRLERNIIRYGLAVMELPKIGAGNEEIAYLAAMLTLGNSIAWDKLNQTPVSTTARRKSGGGPGTGEGFRGGEDN